MALNDTFEYSGDLTKHASKQTDEIIKIPSMSKYIKEIKPGVEVDVYDVLKAFSVTCPATQHAIKKLLCPGQRGVKDAIQDLNEARASIDRAIELL